MIEAQQRNCIKSIHSVPIGLRSEVRWPTNIIHKIFFLYTWGHVLPSSRLVPEAAKQAQIMVFFLLCTIFCVSTANVGFVCL